MTVKPDRFQALFNGFKLEQLFNEWGWNHAGKHSQIDRLCVIDEQENQRELKLICTMGLA